MTALWKYVRQRADEQNLSLAELAKRAGKSRQTIYALSEAHSRLPELQTLVDLALVLSVHPLRLINLVFEDYRLPVRHVRAHQDRGDKSLFLADITIPDGTVVAAGSTFTKVWEVHNSGTVAWENRHLRCMDEEIVVYSRSGETLKVTQGLKPAADRIQVPFTPPGGTVQVSMDFQAPTLPSTCVSYWKSCFEDGSFCFPDAVGLSVKVRVLAMVETSSNTATG